MISKARAHKILLFLLLLAGFALSLTSRAAEPFVEGSLPEQKEARQKVEEELGISFDEATKILRPHFFEKGPFGDKIRALPTPFALTLDETIHLQDGQAQAALALRAFFADVVIGEGKIYSKHPELKKIVQAIANESSFPFQAMQEIWKGKKETDVNFTIAGDFLRGPDGEFYALEFNASPTIGGISDSLFLLHQFAKQVIQSRPDLRNKIIESNFIDIPMAAMHNWVQDITSNDTSKTTFLDDIDGAETIESYMPDLSLKEKDVEWIRTRGLLSKILPFLGRDAILPITYQIKNTKTGEIFTGAEAKTAIEAQNKKLTEVLSRENFFFNFTKLTQPFLINDLLKIYFKAGKTFLNTPGTDILLGDKAIGAYVPDFIRYYLKEEPVLKFPRTELLNPKQAAEFFSSDPRSALEALQGKVLKRTDLAQGLGVFIARPENSRNANFYSQLRSTLRMDKWMGGSRVPLVLQDRIQPSIYQGHHVEFRPFTAIVGEGAFPYDAIWGKAVLPSHNSGKANVSGGALEMLVFTDMLNARRQLTACELALKEVGDKSSRGMIWDYKKQAWKRTP